MGIRVEQQMFRFEIDFRVELQFQLMTYTSFRYWEDMDELDDDTNKNIKKKFHDFFSPWIAMYQYTPIAPILTQCRDTLYYVVWASMNVQYPRDPFLHINYVVDNAYNVYTQMTRNQLRLEMNKVNHHAHLIQRNWRHVIANPRYNVCKSRLMSEFKKMSVYSNGSEIPA